MTEDEEETFIIKKRKSIVIDNTLFIHYDEDSDAKNIHWSFEVCPHIISYRKEIVKVLQERFEEFDSRFGFDWKFQNYEILCHKCMIAEKPNTEFWLTEILIYLKSIDDFEKRQERF